MQENQRNPTLGERIEKIIGIFSPKRALERSVARIKLRFMEGYEAARPWRNSADWFPVDGRAEPLNQASRAQLRAKARYLERNSDVVNSILNAYTRNVVGKGFNLQVKTDNEEWNSLLETVWQEWSRPGNCDVTGQYSLEEMLDLIVRRKLVDGGVLAVKTYDKKFAIPYQLQMREVDEIDSYGQMQSPAGNPIVDVVEVNAVGRPVKFYLRKYDLKTFSQVETEPIDAERVYYLMEKTRATQVREITPLARAIDKTHDLDEFFEATVFKQKINAAIAVWITNSDTASGSVGRGSIAGGSSGGTKGAGGKRIVPGSINELAPGQDIKTLVPAGQSSELETFDLAIMRKVAAGQGLSYEQVSRDVSQVNYSSARQNLLEDWKVFEKEQQFLIAHFLDGVFEDVIRAAVLSGYIPANVVPNDFWSNPQWLKHEFIGQKMPWIDPYKEALANQIMLESYQMTLKEFYGRSGRDYTETVEQIKKEKADLGALAEGQQEGVMGSNGNNNEG